MKLHKTTLFVLTALALTWALTPAGASDSSPGSSADAASAADAPKPDPQASPQETPAVTAAVPGLPFYKPPQLSKPTRTVGGGSRGVGDTTPALYAIVPNHVAQSASKQPSLFWYLDGLLPGKAVIEFTFIDDEAIAPLVEANLAKPDRPGLHRIDLSAYGVNLSPGKEYEWSVSIIIDPDDRSQDIVATGWIECVAQSDSLATRLASEGGDRSVHVFADEGLWYDALTALGDQMQRDPNDPQLMDVRSSLLRQVGLDRVATAPVL
jgi:hypothetical protein